MTLLKVLSTDHGRMDASVVTTMRSVKRVKQGGHHYMDIVRNLISL